MSGDDLFVVLVSSALPYVLGDEAMRTARGGGASLVKGIRVCESLK